MGIDIFVTRFKFVCYLKTLTTFQPELSPISVPGLANRFSDHSANVGVTDINVILLASSVVVNFVILFSSIVFQRVYGYWLQTSEVLKTSEVFSTHLHSLSNYTLVPHYFMKAFLGNIPLFSIYGGQYFNINPFLKDFFEGVDEV